MVPEENHMDNADLRSRVVAFEHAFSAALARLSIVEQWRAQMDILNARRDEQFKNLTDRFDSLNTKIDGVKIEISGDLGELKGSLTWLSRLIIGSIIAGFIAGLIGLLFKLSH